MAHIYHHPAPGLGDLVPGFAIIPQNPIRRATGQVLYVPHIGEFMPATFVVPENPLVRSLQCGHLGCGCGMGNLGFTIPGLNIDTSQITTWLSANLTTVAIAGAGIVGAMWLLGRGKSRSEYSRARAAARAQYTKALGEARVKYPRRIGR